jgi:receptor-type tyrosine-protein phosphatase F
MGRPTNYLVTLFLLCATGSAQASDPPVIKEAPTSQKVKAGGIVAFTCIATGDPTPHITWRKNGNTVTYATSRYQINDFTGGSLLRIEPVRKKREDSEFECVAENGVGDPVSAKATLEVYDEKGLPGGFPRIKQNPAMKVVEKGRNALLVCEAEGDPTVNIYWVKDTMKLTPNPRLTVMQQGKLRGSLQISESQETDQGKYECVAENEVGTEYSYSAQLYVRGNYDL